MANLKDRIDGLRKTFDDAALKAGDAKSLEDLRTDFLGRKRGHIMLLFEDLKSVPPEERREAGRLINELKDFVQERLRTITEKLAPGDRYGAGSIPAGSIFGAKGTAIRQAIDLTLPGRKRYVGTPHPLTLFQEEIERIFLAMGFSIEEGPEIETDYYNFEALNFPPYHPARDKWDTLFIKGDLLLRTHTSPVQVRVMERSKPPIRIICPGRVFRRETPDPTHLPMFMQVEGLVIDEGITFAHLKGTLEYFIRALFGEKVKVRFRPSFFPFTEPSAEVDIECIVCSGSDPACRVCGGTGWKEILGSGMVDPQVLKNVNIDPEKYSGWAFGLGIDRTAMLALGIPEMRYFYENDLRFLRQFGDEMKISQDWIREFVAVDLPRQELIDKLTMIGLVPETVEERDGDLILDLETYANRPDTLGHLGIAREIGAMLGRPLIERDWPVTEMAEATADIADVQIVAEALCPRYCGLVVRGVAVGPSPDWLRRRIEAMGLRPINSVVDVSNYVLFATGQPIHTFDFGRIGGGRIVVRKAKRGETLVDLDGRTLALTPEMLVIADESRPVALAGIIGGQASGITESTRDVFIESANFDPVGIRKTAKKLGLSTDASYRFERGADIGFAPQAARMAASLLTQMGGQASRGLIDRYAKPPKPRTVRLRLRRITELLGVAVPESQIVDVLARLGFRLEGGLHGAWRVEVPTFRVDISREADLIEEVARFYGYDRIPSEVTPVASFAPAVNKKRERQARVRETLLGQGLDEVINWSFADPEKEVAAASGRTAVPIQNPISNRASVMRTTLLPGLLENAAWNLHRGLEGVHIFEMGNVYYWGDDEKHREDLYLGLLSTGLLPGAGLAAAAMETDFYVVKGAVEAVLEALRFDPAGFEERDHPSFEPGRALAVLVKGHPVGHLGRLRPAFAASSAVEPAVYAAEIDLSALFEKTPRPFAYAPVPKFPGVVRDLSFLIGRDVPFGEVARALGKLDQPLVESFELVDRFAGPPVPADKVSLTIRLHFRHPQRTLVAAEVDRAAHEIVGHLGSAFAIQLREGKIDIRT